jgi:tetratricopeptide (TPR) repeat protein
MKKTKADNIENLLIEPSGDIKFYNYTSQSKPAKPSPKGLINLPRERNDFFVEQGNVFARIDAQLKAHQLAYLHGTHGLGKTTTLNEYGFARLKDYDFIFYVLATDASIDGEFARFADNFIETVSPEETPAQKAAKVKPFLEENERWPKETKNWLILFDNLESRDRIAEYFPRTAKGDCLYACNERLFIGNDREVEFAQFSPAEAELFVYQKLHNAPEAKHAEIPAEALAEVQKLIARLGRLPLALNIATVYLKENKIPVDEYISLLNSKVKKFLEYYDTHTEHQNKTAFEAFLVTLDKISNYKGMDTDGEITGKLAESFLNLLIFLAPEDIPEELIFDTLFQTVETSATETPNKILFRETVGLLKRYGLIKENEKPFKYKEKFSEPKTLADGTTIHWEEIETKIRVFDTYRVLQDVLSVRLETEAGKSLLEKLLVVFSGLLPYSEVTTWEIFEKYAVHAFPVAEQAEKLTISNHETFWVCNQNGVYFKDIAKYAEAEYFYQRGKTIAEEFYGQEHKETATSYNNLAELYRTQGRYQEAEPLYKQAIEVREQIQGAEHIDIAVNYNNLALLYDSQERYEEAEPFYLKALAIWGKELGENHPTTATSYNNLAGLYDSQGRYQEAEPLYLKALVIREKELGENHPDTAGSYMNLGAFYYERGNAREGLELCEKALRIYRKTLPAGHPSIQNCEGWVEGIKNSMAG